MSVSDKNQIMRMKNRSEVHKFVVIYAVAVQLKRFIFDFEE